MDIDLHFGEQMCELGAVHVLKLLGIEGERVYFMVGVVVLGWVNGFVLHTYGGNKSNKWILVNPIYLQK